MTKKKTTTKKTKITTTKKTKITTPKLKTRIAIVLDRSSSMEVVREATVNAFNEQVQAIRKNSEKLDTRVSLFTFASIADEPTIWNAPIESLKLLEIDQYKPYGNTAMYDGVGKAIASLTSLPEASDPNCSFLVVVISDGQENCSSRWNSETLAALIKAEQATGRWTFSYLGANQDLSVISRTLNIPIGNTMAFAATSAGVYAASAVNTCSTANYLGNVQRGVKATKDFYKQDDDQTALKPKVSSSGS